MELTLVDPNVAIELMEAMSKGIINLEAVNIIIDALNKGNIEATYKSEIMEDVVYAGGAIYSKGTGKYEELSNIECIINDFNCVKNQSNIDKAISYLKVVVRPKKTYKRKYRRY